MSASPTPAETAVARAPTPRRRIDRILRRLPPILVPVLAVAATIFYALWVNQTFPVRHWLFFFYAKYWLFIALFAAGSTASGWRISRKLIDAAPLGERALLAFGLGVLLFVLGIFVGGLLALLGPVFFFA